MSQFSIQFIHSIRSISYSIPKATSFVVFITLSNAKHGESIVIGLASKGPQVKTKEPIVSIKVTYCSIQLS